MYTITFTLGEVTALRHYNNGDSMMIARRNTLFMALRRHHIPMRWAYRLTVFIIH